MSSKDLSDHIGISQRSVQVALKSLENSNTLIEGYKIRYIHSKGYSLQIVDNQLFTNFISSTFGKSQNDLEKKKLLRQLLLSKCPVSITSFAERNYISRLSAMQLIREIEQEIAPYHLQIISKRNVGTILKGTEIDKRNCIIKEGIINFHDHSSNGADKLSDEILFNTISKVASKILIQEQYHITDIVFQNFLMHLFISTKRMANGNFVSFSNNSITEDSQEYSIVKLIMDPLVDKLGITPTYSEYCYLAFHLKGKNSYDENDYIPEQINNILNDIFSEIKKKTGLDFSYSMELRAALSMHLTPLIQRLRNNSQLTNPMKKQIKKEFPFAFELGAIVASYLEEKIGQPLCEDEVSYIAIHFNLVLFNQSFKQPGKKILVISSSRRSDSLLIKTNLYAHFPSQISEISILNLYELEDENINDYDVVFSTTLNDKRVPESAIHINYFLTEEDYDVISFALSHGDLFEKIKPFFHKSLFLSHLTDEKKATVLEKMCDISSNFVDSDALFESVTRRELSGFTSYDNLIAIPHPDQLISNNTFVCIAILDKKIEWNADTNVQLVMLLCVSKASQSDLKILFDVVSRMMHSPSIIEDIIQNQTFDNFIKNLKKALTSR